MAGSRCRVSFADSEGVLHGVDVEPRVSMLEQVMKWADPTTKEGPAGITKRQRVRTLIGAP
jgi:hypothetical protein